MVISFCGSCTYSAEWGEAYLSDEGGHVGVLEEDRKHLINKAALIQYLE